MTKEAIGNVLKPLITNKTLYYFQTTSVNRFYFSNMDNPICDDINEVVKFIEISTGLGIAVDYNDINIVVELTDKAKTMPTYLLDM